MRRYCHRCTSGREEQEYGEVPTRQTQGRWTTRMLKRFLYPHEYRLSEHVCGERNWTIDAPSWSEEYRRFWRPHEFDEDYDPPGSARRFKAGQLDRTTAAEGAPHAEKGGLMSMNNTATSTALSWHCPTVREYSQSISPAPAVVAPTRRISNW